VACGWYHAINPSTPTSSTSSTDRPPHPSPPDHPRSPRRIHRVVWNPSRCLTDRTQRRMIAQSKAGQIASGGLQVHQLLTLPDLVASRLFLFASVFCGCNYILRYWQVLNNVSSIGKGGNTGAASFQSRPAGRRRAPVAEWRQPLFVLTSWERWGCTGKLGGLTHSTTAPHRAVGIAQSRNGSALLNV
jgi:hypothetical protein